MHQPMNMAFVGTGYVSDQYALTLRHHPELRLVGAFSTNAAHLADFCRTFPTRAYASLQEVLDDPAVEMVINLTNPRSHDEVNRRSLEAGKHVYSEKPLSMSSENAAAHVALARSRVLGLASAPCNLLSASAQTLLKAVRDGAVGRPLLVYANFEDGLIAPRMEPWTWPNQFGACWPGKDEFEIGCTYEHAGYVLSLLAMIFGPARRVTAFASCQIHDKGIPVDKMAPDFTVGCLEYDGGVVARVTCGLVAPRDKSITIVGDKGVLHTENVRNDAGPIYLRNDKLPWLRQKWKAVADRAHNHLTKFISLPPREYQEWAWQEQYPFAIKPSRSFVDRSKRVDFLTGPSELAASIRENRPCRLSPELGLHVVELIEALQYPERYGYRREIRSGFEPIKPLY